MSSASSYIAQQAAGVNEITNIGKYTLEKTIGQGSYGKVRLGMNRETQQKVAVKIIEKKKLKSQKQINRLQREIRFLKLLHHPHIIQVYDVIETTEEIYIVMEYAKGGELFDYIVANKRVKEKEARSFFRQVLSAVDYCHQNAVIHRDLKPENLLLDEKKCIKIIDFGFGNNFSTDGKLLDTFCGSPFYAAPEMILGKKYEGPEVDMWSLGVILFALLCGHLPFDDDDIQLLYRKIASGTYTSPDYLMPNARHLINRLIIVDPKQRATLKEVMSHPWVVEGYDGPPPSYVPERPIIRETNHLSLDIVKRLFAFGYNDEDVRHAFNANADYAKPNAVRATYFLLVEMLQREQIKLNRQKAIEQSKRLYVQTMSAMSLNSLSMTSPRGFMGTPSTPDTAPADLENVTKKNPIIHGPSPSVNKKDFHSMMELGPSSAENQHNQVLFQKQQQRLQQQHIPGYTTHIQQHSYPVNQIQPQVYPVGYGNQQQNHITSPSVPMVMSEHSQQNGTNNAAPLMDARSKTSSGTQASPYYGSGSHVQTRGDVYGTVGPLPPTPAEHFGRRGSTPVLSNTHHNYYPVAHPSSIAVAAALVANKNGGNNSTSSSVSTSSPIQHGYQLSQQSFVPSTSANMASNTSISTNGTLQQVSLHEQTLIQQQLQRRPSTAARLKEEFKLVSGWFMNVSTTSSKSPELIVQEIERASVESGVNYSVDMQQLIVTCQVDVGHIPSHAVIQQQQQQNLQDGYNKLNQQGISSNNLSYPSSSNFIQNDSGNERSAMEGLEQDQQHQRLDFNGTKTQDQSTSVSSQPYFMEDGHKKSSILVFQIEICRVPKSPNLYGLHFKRLQGGVWNYKKVCHRLLAEMKL